MRGRLRRTSDPWALAVADRSIDAPLGLGDASPDTGNHEARNGRESDGRGQERADYGPHGWMIIRLLRGCSAAPRCGAALRPAAARYERAWLPFRRFPS